MWTKSSYSGGDGACLEWHAAPCSDNACVEAASDKGSILIRDSKDREGPVLTFSPEAWAGFVAGVKAGDFDL